jgi:tetratricopeptide (TPR) repeat protein
MSGLDPEIQLPINLSLDNHAGPASRIPQERLESMVATALVEFDKLHPAQTQPAAKSSIATTSVKSTWLVAAGSAVLIAGGMLAARYFTTPEPKALPPAPAAVVAPAPEPTLPPTAAVPDADDSVSQDQAEQEVDEASPNARVLDKGRRSALRGTSAPEDLLQKANQLRAAGQFRDAAQTYSLVYDRFPKSQAAYVSRVAAGSLELEHLSNPLKARKLFESALTDRPKGALDLEARQGLSVALRDLEDRSGEREVLRSLVTRHPGSPAARRAQVRLMELGGE